MLGPTQNLGPIGSAGLTFIGNKRTDTLTDRQAKNVYISNPFFDSFSKREVRIKSCLDLQNFLIFDVSVGPGRIFGWSF